jgi:hypothetical protein
MKLRVGDVLVFVGNAHLQNKHYENFEVGKSYRISRMEKIGYDLDEFTGYNNDCVFFEKHSYGCLVPNISQYFVTIEDYRNQKINKIIE